MDLSFQTEVLNQPTDEHLRDGPKEKILNQQEEHVAAQMREKSLQKSLKNDLDLDQTLENKEHPSLAKDTDQMSQKGGTKTGHSAANHHCTPKKNIVFIKTIKTGGSTLTNILSRYTMKHNLNIHGQEGCTNQVLSQQVCPLQKMSLDLPGLGKSNVISDHLLYDRKILSDVTLNGTIYVTQLRHPLSQLISWFNYRGHYIKSNPAEDYDNLHPFIKYSKWNSWRQLCIPDDHTGEKFQPYIQLLENEFDLVTITEQFDLSLLLLRRKLCWDIGDMLYIPLKRANYKLYHNERLQNVSGNELLNIAYQKLNPNAYSLYNHFNSRLSKLITQEGSDLQEELKFFQELKQKLTDYCSKYIEHLVQNVSTFPLEVDSNNVLLIPASRWGSSHTVDPIDCAMMKLHKLTYQIISVMKKLSKDFIATHIPKIRRKTTRELYRASAQPVNLKYGVPLPVLNHAHAYDLNENVLRHGEMVRHRDFREEISRHRANVNNIHSCIADNNEERHTNIHHERHDMSELVRGQAGYYDMYY